MGIWSLISMKRMCHLKRLVLVLCVLSFIFVFSYIKEHSDSDEYIYESDEELMLSVDPIVPYQVFNTKFVYFNDSVVYDKKRCFHLTWNYTRKVASLSDLGTSRCKRFITIAKSKGRTGNDMFQIATILGLAYTYDLIPVIHFSFPLNKYFNLPNVVNLKKEKFSNHVNLRANHVAIYKNFSQRLETEFHNFTMEGNFQSWRYFNSERDMIKNALRLKSVHLANAERYMNIINPKGYKQISIHIRRGDFSAPVRLQRGYAVVNESYVEKAKKILQQNESNVVFFVVTNDKKWCSENLKDVHISPFDNPGDDMALMALSDHVVVSAGTFGWWGAWLAGGNVVYYKEFPRTKSYLATLFSKYDYYPPNWIGTT